VPPAKSKRHRAFLLPVHTGESILTQLFHQEKLHITAMG
jgi:hypothetical protein